MENESKTVCYKVMSRSRGVCASCTHVDGSPTGSLKHVLTAHPTLLHREPKVRHLLGERGNMLLKASVQLSITVTNHIPFLCLVPWNKPYLTDQ